MADHTDFHHVPQTPTNTAVDPKDSNEYEHGFQRKRRNRIILIATACVVVVGAAVAIAVTSMATTSAPSLASSDKTVVSNSTAVSAVNATTPPPSYFTTQEPSTSEPSSTTETPIVNATTTIAPTPEPTETTQTPTTTPTTTTPTATTTTAAPTTTTTTTSAPTTTTATPPTAKPVVATPAPPPPAPPAPPAPTPPPAGLANGMFLFQNNCGKSVNLYRSHALITSLAPGGSLQVDGTKQAGQMFHFGWDSSGDATLFETHFGADGRFYYDISIIPVRCGASWDFCTGPSSFNLAMTVAVRPGNGANLQHFPTCKTLQCGSATCPVAYKVPNDVKTMVCPKEVSMTISAC